MDLFGGIAKGIGSLFGFGGNDNNNNSNHDHEESMQSARLTHESNMDRATKAHELALQRERDAANERAQKLAAVAAEAERKSKLELKQQANEQDKYLAKLSAEETDKQRQHIEAESARNKAHEVHLENLEQEKLRIKQETERQQQKHEEDLKQIWIDAKTKDRENKEKQKQEALQRIKEVIDGLESQKTQSKNNLIDIKQEHESIIQSVKIQDDKIKNFDKNGKLKEERKEMDAGHADWKRNDDEIMAAIDKAGVHESNVARFLRLTHGLIGETVESQIQANKLDAELHTFSILISRECQDKLEIETLFTAKRLDRFIAILAKQNYIECSDLICEDEEEFQEDILNVVQEEIDKEINEWKKRNPNKGDSFDLFLDDYRLSKFKQGLKRGGLECLDDISDITEQEDIDELIEEAKITGLHKKKLKRAINDVQNGKYKPPESQVKNDENDGKDEIKENIEEKEDIKPLEISKKEERVLRKICTKPDEWKQLEQMKINLTKLALLEMTPLLGTFFSKMHKAIKQSEKLLNYGGKLNDEQNKAMSVLMDNIKPKAIKAPKDDDDDNKENDDPSNLPDYEQRKAWEVGSECQIYSKSKDKWYIGQVIKIFDDKEGEWLEIKYEAERNKFTKEVDRYGPDIRDPVTIECRAISSAIIVDINVVDTMIDEFKVSPISRRALIVAHGVEQSAKAIMLCQSQIRESMRLAAAILKLKPANLTETSQALWTAVSNGIVHIISTALEMSKISAQYFGFFLQFNQSFQRFISMNQQNENVPLMISLEHLKNDIRNFSKFKQEFNRKLQKLSDETMKVIRNCVDTQIGVETFNKAQIEREKSKQIYLEKKEIYDKKSLNLDEELEKLCISRANHRAIEAKLDLKVKQMQESINRDEEYIKLYTQRQTELLQLNFDAFGQENEAPKDDNDDNDDGNLPQDENQ